MIGICFSIMRRRIRLVGLRGAREKAALVQSTEILDQLQAGTLAQALAATDSRLPDRRDSKCALPAPTRWWQAECCDDAPSA